MELQKHPFPAGAQPGPNPQPLYLPLEPPVLTFHTPNDPPPAGSVAVKLDARLQGSGGSNPPGTVIRYTTDGSDPSTVEFPAFSLNPSNTGSVYFGGQPDWITVPSGTVIRARATVVDFYSTPPPPGQPAVVAERIIADSPPATFTAP